jgi:hypothetical protein
LPWMTDDAIGRLIERSDRDSADFASAN